jgi:hypothetical protein
MTAPTPEIGVEYAVGLDRRRAVVRAVGLDYQAGPYLPVRPGIGVLVEWLGEPTTPLSPAVGAQEVVHPAVLGATWADYVECEERKAANRAHLKMMRAEIAGALGCAVDEPRPGVPGVRVALEALHGYVVTKHAAADELRAEVERLRGACNVLAWIVATEYPGTLADIAAFWGPGWTTDEHIATLRSLEAPEGGDGG